MNRKLLLEQLRIDRTESPPEDRSLRRRWLIAFGIGFLVFILAGVTWFFASAHDRIPVRAVIAKAVNSAEAGASSGTSLLDATGYVVALREATVSAKAIYKVQEVLIQEGQAVKKGQVVARLDDSNARAALGQARAQVKQLEAALAAAKLAAADAQPTFLRAQRQLTEGLISPDTFDVSKANYDAMQAAASVAQENLTVAKAVVEVNQRYADDTIIKAPFDGVVTVKSAQPGEIVSPQFSGGGGIAKIVDMDSLEVDVDVNENFINRVRPAQPATITLDAYPDWHIPAEVIAVIPTADRSKATVKVRIAFKSKDARIVPEMGARVAFLDDAPAPGVKSPSGQSGVIVPAEAVLSEGNDASVFVIRGDVVERRAVRLGTHAADGQVIVSGLPPGAVVAVGDLSKLHDRSRVRAVQ